MQEQLQYSVNQKQSRALIPKVLTLTFLGAIFYVGILVNLSLLNISKTENQVVKWVSLVIIIALVSVGLLLTHKHSSEPYRFYQTYLTITDKPFQYKNIIDTSVKRNVFDKWFNTYSIHLGKKTFLKHIPTEVPLQNYIQQLATYAHSS